MDDTYRQAGAYCTHTSAERFARTHMHARSRTHIHTSTHPHIHCFRPRRASRDPSTSNLAWYFEDGAFSACAVTV
eukprot:2607967-Pleurochrysis_carterae.AAC.1